MTGPWLMLQVVAVIIHHSTCAALEGGNPGAITTPAVVPGHIVLPSTCVAVDSLTPGAPTTPAAAPVHTVLPSTFVAVVGVN